MSQAIRIDNPQNFLLRVQTQAKDKGDIVYFAPTLRHLTIALHIVMNFTKREFCWYVKDLAGDIPVEGDGFFMSAQCFIRSGGHLNILTERMPTTTSEQSDDPKLRLYHELQKYKERFPNNIDVRLASREFTNTVAQEKLNMFAYADDAAYIIEPVEAPGVRDADIFTQPHVCCNNEVMNKKLRNIFDKYFEKAERKL